MNARRPPERHACPGAGCAVVLAALAMAGCADSRAPVETAWTCMGTFASVAVPAGARSRLDKAAERVRARMAGLESALSLFNPNSEISRLNGADPGTAVPVSETTRRVLELAVQYGELSGGAFDPTVAPLMRLWGFHGAAPPEREPGADAIAAALEHTGFRHVLVSGAEASLMRPGMGVDLGGIAKGFAVDVAYNELASAGYPDVMVNLGGNIRCAGNGRPDAAWIVGVRDPFDRRRVVGVLRLTGGMAVATSGNYERFVTIGDRRYAHIIDPRTGRPVEGMAGVTAVSATAVEADTMSTALFVAGVRGAADILARVPGTQALLIPDEQPLTLWMTPGFRAIFEPAPGLGERILDLPAGG